MEDYRIRELLDRIANLLRAEAWHAGSAHGLPLAQLQALAYLSRCNRLSDTPAAVAEYLGATRGTVSQTLRALEAKGLVERSADAADRRATHLAPTPAGHRLLGEALPPLVVVEALEALDPGTRRSLEAGLTGFLAALQRAHGGRSFGVCHTCRHHLQDEAGGRRCGLTGLSLDADQSAQICREHARSASEGSARTIVA